MIRTARAAAMLLACAMPAHATTLCQEKPGTGEYWRWRQIDGRQCWFAGKRNLEKSELAWPQQETPSPQQQETPPPQQPNVSTVRSHVMPDGMSGRNSIGDKRIDLMNPGELHGPNGDGSVLIIPPYRWSDGQ